MSSCVLYTRLKTTRNNRTISLDVTE